ncbi:MAG: anthranilate synthase component II [Bacteroidota bacterium]
MILVIDNFDSFTYNLVQLIGKVRNDIVVYRNTELTVEQIIALKPERILISPGPGRPEDAGVSVDVIKTLGMKIPTLGVCLGHQGIGLAFGGRVVHAPTLMHGRTSEVYHSARGIFAGLPSPFVATRYHSLVIAADSLPDALEISARTEDGIIMGVRHKEYPIEGVQFHPESILTCVGEMIIRNWLQVQ